MHVALFIPCYIDQFYPDVGLATAELLERYGAEVEFPEAQTCCGQPLSNTGCFEEARPLADRFLEIFQPYPYIVTPSGSCAAMVRHHYHALVGDSAALHEVQQKTFELCEFLTDVIQVGRIVGRFPYRVGLHPSCHGLRELRLGSSSEIVGQPHENKARRLLESLDDITLTEPLRPDECCGFGGTFAVTEQAVSCMMGMDRIADHEHAGTEVLTAGDMSCLMHLEGLLRRRNKPMHVMHIAQILAGRPVPSPS